MSCYAKKRYICDTVMNMERDELINIYSFLKKQHVDEKLFNQVSDGIKINLDAVPETAISALYCYIKFMVDSAPASMVL